MSLTTFIESQFAGDEEFETAFLQLQGKELLSAKLHRNQWLFGLLRGKPYIDLWVHHFLINDASWNDRYLRLEPEGNEALYGFMAEFIALYRGPFGFWTMWSGDEVKAPTIETDASHFLERIKENRLSIKYKYQIRASKPDTW